MIISKLDRRYQALKELARSEDLWKDDKCPGNGLYVGAPHHRPRMQNLLIGGGYLDYDSEPTETEGVFTLTQKGKRLISRWDKIDDPQLENELRHFDLGVLRAKVRGDCQEIKRLKAEIRLYESTSVAR